MNEMSERLPLELPSHDDLARLARDDPPAYEALRRELIENFIASAPARLKPRLMGIQFRIDHVRRLSRSPLGATVRVYELMWKSFLTLNQNWQEFVELEEAFLLGQEASECHRFLPVREAQILEFRSNKHKPATGR